ncbi:LexA family transcriptional regulator, partial [Acinetobacter baumannii]|nr:LexA family transcriptional regulator [Acinetobacter baumannii]
SILELATALGVTAEELKKGIVSKFDNNVEPITKKLIPVLSWVQAGTMTSVEAIDPNKINEWLPPLSADDPDGCFYLRVVGVSNSPTYVEGDYILV